jgi:hypothetical protein
MVPYPLQFTKTNEILTYLFIQEFDVLRTRKWENEEGEGKTIKIMGIAIDCPNNPAWEIALGCYYCIVPCTVY